MMKTKKIKIIASTVYKHTPLSINDMDSEENKEHTDYRAQVKENVTKYFKKTTRKKITSRIVANKMRFGIVGHINLVMPILEELIKEELIEMYYEDEDGWGAPLYRLKE